MYLLSLIGVNNFFISSPSKTIQQALHIPSARGKNRIATPSFRQFQTGFGS